MDTQSSLNRAVWEIQKEFDRMFLVFPIGRYFCYRTDADVYFLLDAHPDRLSAVIRFALNLNYVEDSLFDKEVEIDASKLDKDELMRRIVIEILAYTDEFPSRKSCKPKHTVFS